MGLAAAFSLLLGFPLSLLSQGAPNDDDEPSIPGLPHGALARLESTGFWHEAPVISAVIPPDGKRLVCLDAEGFLTGWDRSTRKRLYCRQATDRGHRDRRISCSPDGTWIVLSVRIPPAPTVTVFQLATGDEVCRIERCSGAIFSSRDTIITAWHRGQLRRWELESGEELARPQSSPLDLLSVDVSADGGVIAATVAGWGEPMVWDGRTGKRLGTQKPGQIQSTGVAVSPDGRTIAVGNPWLVTLWSTTPDGAVVRSKHQAHGGPPLRFSSDGQRLVGALRPKRIGVWTVETMEAVATYGYPSTVHGFFEVSARADEVIHARGPWVLIEPMTPGEDELQALPPASPVDFVAFTPEGRGVTCDPGGTVRFWEPTTGRPLRAQEVGRFSHMALFRDGVKAAILENESTLRVLDLGRNVEGMKLEKLHHVRSMVWSPDGKRLAIGSYDKFIAVWDVVEQREEGRIPTEGIAVTAIAWSPDGKSIAWGEPSGEVAFADAKRGVEQTRYRSRGGPITAIAFLPGGATVVTGDAGGAVRRWDNTPLEQPAFSGRHTAAVSALAISPDGRWIAAGDARGGVVLWPSIDGPETRLCQGQSSAVSSLAFSPDGALLLVGVARDGAAVWKTPEGR